MGGIQYKSVHLRQIQSRFSVSHGQPQNSLCSCCGKIEIGKKHGMWGGLVEMCIPKERMERERG